MLKCKLNKILKNYNTKGNSKGDTGQNHRIWNSPIRTVSMRVKLFF